jgi:TonB family protein
MRRGALSLFGSLFVHSALGVCLLLLHPFGSTREVYVSLSVEAVPPPPPSPPPPPPPPEPPPPVEEHAPSPAPVVRHQPRARKAAAAAGPRPEAPPPTTEAAPLPPAEPSEPEAVELPSGEGTGAGGVESAGNGEPGGGSGDGRGDGDGGRPPIPLDATRHARLPYTRDAIEAHVGGIVLVNVLVDEQGAVAEAELVKPIGYGLDPLALVAARRFKFLPARDSAGRPVRQWITWRFHFEPAN